MTRYTSRADLLIAAGNSIKLQESAGIEPACKCKSVAGHMIVASIASSDFSNEYCLNAEYEFPLAVVEGKPVFVGDELYWNSRGIYQAVKIHHKEDHFFVSENLTVFPINEATWNPPKSKTVMVELLREEAQIIANNDTVCILGLKLACRKALEKA